MKSKVRLVRSIVLIALVSLPLFLTAPASEAGVLDDATQSVLRQTTGINERTPTIVLTQSVVKPALNATADVMIDTGSSAFPNVNNVVVLPPTNGMGPGYAPAGSGVVYTGGGYVIKGALTVIKVYDTGKTVWTIDDYSRYDSSYSPEAIKIDKSLQVVEGAAGVGELVAGGFVLAGAPEAAPFIGVFAGTKYTLKITRAVMQDSRHAYNFLRPQKIPPNATFDPIGLLNGGKPCVYVKFPTNTFRYPGAFPVGGSGYWAIPLDSIKGDPDFYYVIMRVPYEVGINNLHQEIPNPWATGVPVYKPNIYLYHPTDGIVNVRLIDEGLITASDPLYPNGSGWSAALTGGSINGWGDYLFYEASLSDTLFQRETGWLVCSGRQLQDMTAILDEYGFNAREKADFLEFWGSKLNPEQTYIFFNQETPTVDQAMPLETDRAFAERHRIWFLIEAYQDQLFAKPVSHELISQHENALVEWGGIMAD